MSTRNVALAIRYAVLAILGLIWLLPFYLLISNASKSIQDYSGSTVWLPGNPAALMSNLSYVFTQTGILGALESTTIYSIAAPLIVVLLGSAIGYAIIVLKLRHGFGWFFFIFCGTVIPAQLLVLPLFSGFVRVGIFDTHLGMIIAYSAACLPFAAFVMRNFFAGIAHSVFEAAVIDGAGTWRTFWRIYLPMSVPALIVVFILQATWVWNDLLFGLVLTQSSSTRPVMTALTALQSTQGGGANFTVLLAAALFASLPTTLLFIVFHRSFSRGLSLGQY